MNAPVRIILWQLWRLTRWEILASILGLYAIVGMFVLIIQANPFFAFRLVAPVVFILMFALSLLTVMSPSWYAARSNPNNPMPFPLYLDYAQPVRTATLVLLCMVYGCMKTAAVYLALAIPVNHFLGASLPAWSFACWLAFMAAIVQAAIWSSATPAGRMWGYLLSFVGIAGCFVTQLSRGHHGIDNLLESAEPLSGLFVFSSAGYLVLMLSGVGACAVAWAGIEQQRHGEAFFPRLRKRTAVEVQPKFRSARSFSGPVQAQLWCEARRALLSPLVFPVGMAALILLMGVFGTVFSDEAEPDAMVALWLLMVVAAIFSSVVLTGHFTNALRLRGGEWRYSTFEATLPIETGQLSAIKVATIAAGQILALAVIAVSTGMALGPLLLSEEWVRFLGGAWNELAEGDRGFAACIWAAAGVIVLVWGASAPSLLFAFGAASTAAPRRFSLAAVVLGADLFLTIFLMLFKCPMHLYGLINTWGLAVMVVGGLVWSFYRVLERRYLNKRVLASCALVWAVYAAAWGLMLSQRTNTPSATELGFAVALLFAPLLAISLPQLALAAHRHR